MWGKANSNNFFVLLLLEALVTLSLVENEPYFENLGTTATNQNLIQEEIKRRLNSCNVCYHSAQNTLSFCLLPKNFKN
jgi:hypothetical protein